MLDSGFRRNDEGPSPTLSVFMVRAKFVTIFASSSRNALASGSLRRNSSSASCATSVRDDTYTGLEQDKPVRTIETGPRDCGQSQCRRNSRVRWRLQFTLKSGIGEGSQREKKRDAKAREERPPPLA